MSVYRTAQGKSVDMSQLAAKNQTQRAVSNMNVNARGDIIDSSNRVVVPASKKVGNRYQATVSNRAANLVKPQADEPAIQNMTVPVVAEPMLDEELEFMDTTAEDAEIARIKEMHEQNMREQNEKDERQEKIRRAKELQAKMAEEAIGAKNNVVIKPASEAPDFFDPTKE
jgi:hypothetical protein